MNGEYEKLKKELNYHSHLYYVLDNPTITDGEYDAMLRRLIEMEEKDPSLISPDSPSQKIGGTILIDVTPKDLGRMAVLNARQVIEQKLKDIRFMV